MVGWDEIDLDHGELDFRAWVLALAQDPAIRTTHGRGIENLCHATVPTPGPGDTELVVFIQASSLRPSPVALEWTPRHSVGSMTIEACPEAVPPTAPLGIADVAEMSGLTPETLRWWEREGLVPPVTRGSDRRRRYSEREAAFVVMLAKLRSTGMPTEDMREFSRLVAGGAATHGRRLAILELHRQRIRARQAVLTAGLAALDEKAGHYRKLIEAGLDCDGAPVSPEVAFLQAHPTTNGSAS